VFNVITRLNIGRYCCKKKDPSQQDKKDTVVSADAVTERALEQCASWVVQSLVAQTDRDFGFFLLVDNRTSDHLKTKISEAIRVVGGTILYDKRKGYWKEKITVCDGCGWLEDYRMVCSGAKRVSTARVDIDDFLMPRFVEIMKSLAVNCGTPALLDPLNYFYVDSKREFYVSSDNLVRPSECCVMVERVRDVGTPYRVQHTKLHKITKTQHLIGVEELWGKRVHYKGERDELFERQDQNGQRLPFKHKDFNSFLRGRK